MSLGHNPFYANTHRSVEVHILHNFQKDFYGAYMKVLMLGFIRPEYDYDSLDSLVGDIKCDIEVTKRSLLPSRGDGWKGIVEREREWLMDFNGKINVQ